MSCPPVVPSVLTPRLYERWLESGTEMLRAASSGMGAYWSGAVRRGATPWDLWEDAARWWGVATRRDRPRWHTPHEVVFESAVARLRDFSQGAADDVVPTLVLPPQAGHDSCIVDYSARQSQMKVIRAAGLTRAYSLDWVGATPETKDVGIDEYLEVIERAVAHIGGPVNLVGDCQGGWLATIYAALRPEQVNTLTIAGAPVDFQAGDGVIHDYVSLLGSRDLRFYRWVVAQGGGVLKGEYMLNGFILIKPESEVAKQVALLANIRDPEHVERHHAFETWFKHTQDIPGAFYLWIVEHLFAGNEMVRGALEVGGETVDLGRIDCPVMLLAGDRDHITPPAQVFALADHVSTPAGEITALTASGGHLGLFMGSEALREHWPPLLAKVYERSRGGADHARAERTARRQTPLAAPPIAAP